MPIEDDLQEESLIHLIYASAATTAFSDADLIQLLEKARLKNDAHGVTGMLLHSDGSFFQVLEGEEQDVKSIYRTIAADTRHAQIVKIIEEPIAERAFGDWSMSFTTMTAAELQSISGFNDMIEGGQALLQLSKGRAKKLLSAFIDGRWRSKLAA